MTVENEVKFNLTPEMFNELIADKMRVHDNELKNERARIRTNAGCLVGAVIILAFFGCCFFYNQAEQVKEHWKQDREQLLEVIIKQDQHIDYLWNAINGGE